MVLGKVEQLAQPLSEMLGIGGVGAQGACELRDALLR